MSIKVYLTIRSDCRNPEYFTSYFGIKPNFTRNKGGINRPGQTPFVENVWAVMSPSVDEINMEAHVAALVAMLEPYRAKLCSLPEDCSVDLDCHVRITDENAPIIGVDRHSVRFLAEIGAEIGIDYS